MNALDSLFRPLAAIANRQIRLQTAARELCVELEGRTFAVRLDDTALAIYVSVIDHEVVVGGGYVGEPDVLLSGSLVSLARLAGPAGEEMIRGGNVAIRGDALLAQKFRRLLALGMPDAEEELSHVVGDTLAHGVGEFVRGVRDWGRNAGVTMQQNVSEYLQEERRAVPRRDEADAFRRDVSALRDDVARLEARLAHIESERDRA